MVTKFYKYLDLHANGKTVFFLFVITQIVYGIMMFFTIPKVHEYSNGIKILDLQPAGYSAQYVQRLFENLGEQGRNTYLYIQIPPDLIYPALFAITYSLLLTFMAKKFFSQKSIIRYFSVIPILAGLFDYFENIGIIVMLSFYPVFLSGLANVTSVFTLLKSVFTILLFIILTIQLIKPLVNKLKTGRFIQNG